LTIVFADAMLGLVRLAAIEPVLVDVPLRTPVRGLHGTTEVQRSLPPGLEASINPDALKRYRVR